VEIEAVTIDAFGTLVGLRDPVPALRAALRERGDEVTERTVQRDLSLARNYLRMALGSTV